MKKRVLLSIMLMGAVSLSAASISAQSPYQGFDSHSFKGLRLDVSTVSDTTQLLGPAGSDKTGVALEGVNWFKHWFGNNAGKKMFRKLTYKDLGGFREVEFYFLEDKLVSVKAELPSPFIDDKPFLSPNDLDAMFDVELKTFQWAFGRKLPPLNEFGPKPDHRLESGLPFYYLRIGVNETSIVSNSVDNNNENYTKGFIGKRLSPTKKKWDEINAFGPFPGYVSSIQIISRRLTSQQ